MDDRNINDLKYGHFGQPTYSLEDGTWLFGRRPGHDGQLRQLGSWKTAIASPVQQDDNFDIPSTAAITKEAKAISENRPELVPSLEFLPGEVLTSAAVISTVHFYDAAIGSLLSFGSTAVQGTYTYPQRVAAFASGNSGNILQLAVLSKLRSGWLDGSVSIEGPSFSNSTSGYWNQDAAPLQQVCFAQSDARSTFLAVRTLSRTNIFRPRLHSRGQPAQQSQFYTLPSSIVDPHFVLSISQEQTGGAPHADVTFNPEYQRQFGLIDQQGNWGIWDIDRRRDANRASEVFASCYVIGQVREETDTVCPQRRDDGWARITWIGDVNTIFVCSRRKAEVFNVRGGQPTPLQCPSVLSERSPDWILDVKIVPMNRHRLCVLTSTRLFLLAVTCQDDLVPTIDFARGMRVLLSWTHFRGTDDISLQLSVCSANENDTTVFLYSRLNQLITIFRSNSHESSPNDLYSSSDPISLHLDDEVFGTVGRSPQINSIYMERLKYKEGPKPAEGPGSSYMTNNVQFHRVSILLSDLSIQQAVFYSCEVDEPDIPQTQLVIEPLSWDTIVHTRVTGIKSDNIVKDDDEFIVPDGPDDVSLHGVGASSKLLHRRTSSKSDDMAKDSHFDDIDMKLLYDAMTSAGGASSNAEGEFTEPVDITHVLDEIGTLLNQDVPLEDVFSGTMLELVENAIRVPDIDDASHRLQALLSPEEQTQPLRLQSIASPTVLGLSHNGDNSLDMASVYDAVLENWIAPLQASIPNRLRQQKERLARRIAAEVMLSSSRIRRPVDVNATSAPDAEKARFSQDSAVALPPLPVLSSQPLPSSLSMPSSQLDPSSVQGGSSEAPIGVHPNPLARLSQHIQFTKPPPVVPPNISNILTHWKLGADPHEYDWAATERILNEEVTSDDEAGQKDKERLKRKAERLLKRQKRELERERKQAESQPLFGRDIGGMRSSPGPALATGIGLSSQTQSQSQSQSQGFGTFDAVQSQLEPGRHGGRPVKKKKVKGKGRISGF